MMQWGADSMGKAKTEMAAQHAWQRATLDSVFCLATGKRPLNEPSSALATWQQQLYLSSDTAASQ